MRYTRFFLCSLFPVPCSLFPAPLFPAPYSLLPKTKVPDRVLLIV
ncbi:hypothetical protein [Moorena sp. SIOASIH]|nr:hypothetical protein [Moorena sp. SIOASIH]